MKKCMHLPLWLWGFMALLPVSAWAHIGHERVTGFAAGFSHPVGGADHLLAMLAVGLWAAQMRGRAFWVVPAAFVTLMLFGEVLAISGSPIPYVEQGILLSVLVLGALIAAARTFPLVISVFIVGIFAIFHGYAHGVAMPSANDVASYSLGFALATSLLHATGMTCGVALKKMNIEKSCRFAGGAIVLAGVYLTMA